jgi:hypothetical protein
MEVERLRESNKYLIGKSVLVFNQLVRSSVLKFMADAKLINVKKDHIVQE